MNIQALRYIVAIEHFGSINRAAQELFISQSSLSRAVKETEAQIGFPLFQRTNQGAIATHDGLEFINRTQSLLQEIDQLEGRYFSPAKVAQDSLLVATQRCTPVVDAFVQYYQQYCGGREFLNFALQEEITDNIIRLLVGRVYNIGVLHYTSDQEKEFLKKCSSLNLEYHLLQRSPVVVQCHRGHPLSKYESITISMLEPYPHITYSDEDITNINYCSDVSQYNPAILKKRIVVQDRATLHQFIDHTNGYYIGSDFSQITSLTKRDSVFIPLRDVDFTLNTIWINRCGHVLSATEQGFIQILTDKFHCANQTEES